jgi:hypothetical protein
MKSRFAILSLLLLLGGCASPASVLMSGCHPSTDLPSVKTIKKVPEAETSFEDLFKLFAQERKAHGDDIRDYNSLYQECVTDAAADR